MPSFDLDAKDLAFNLAQNSAVTLFWRTELLDEATTWFADQGYQLVRLDAAAWAEQLEFHREIKAALDFPDYYGHNLDALNDCLRDVARYTYGADRDATGTVLVFTGYDAFTNRHPRTAQVVLDIIAGNARLAMLFGHRLLCLVQSNDPEIRFDPVGSTPVMWNPAEWLNSDRAVRRR